MELYDAHPEGRYRSSFMRSLETVKREIPLEDYAGTLTDLSAFGRGWLTGRCPLPGHADANPSFFIYPEGAGPAHFHCYGCGAHGDLFDLFRACEGGELWTAMVELSQRFAVELPKRPDSWHRRQERQKPVRDAIGGARFMHLRRRLFRAFFAPSVARIEDADERRAEAEILWGATELLARLMVERLAARGG